MKEASHFWDNIADKYASHTIKDPLAYEHKLAKTREYFTPESQVLEFACGTGSTALLHAPYVASYRGVDISQRMIEIAQAKPRLPETKQLRFEVSSIETLASEETQYDAILGMSILHLLNDPQGAIGQVFNMLKSGGVFVSSTVCLGDGYNYMKPLVWIGKLLGKAPKVNFLKQEEIERWLIDHGFVIEYEWSHTKGMSTAFLIARKP